MNVSGNCGYSVPTIFFVQKNTRNYRAIHATPGVKISYVGSSSRYAGGFRSLCRELCHYVGGSSPFFIVSDEYFECDNFIGQILFHMVHF